MKRIKFSNTTKVTPFAPLRLTYFCLLKKKWKIKFKHDISPTDSPSLHYRAVILAINGARHARMQILKEVGRNVGNAQI